MFFFTLNEPQRCQSSHSQTRYTLRSLVWCMWIWHRCRHLQIEYIWVSRHFLRIIIYSDIAAEQALDMGVNVICSRVYTGHVYDAVLGLIINNSQARYFGLCSVVYVYSCCGTYQLILNRFARIDAICMFKPRNPEFVQLTRSDKRGEFIPTRPCKGDSAYHWQSTKILKHFNYR